MNCKELQQDIQELVEKRQELVEALDDATSSGWGRNKIEGICDEHKRKFDATLEKYLPDFRERFPEFSKMELAGKLKSIITGSKVTTLWGGTVVVSTSFVSSPVAQSIVENPDGSLSAGEKIETFKPKFDDDFVEISDDRCLVVSNRIGVGIVVKRWEYVYAFG